jgi:hypothetical protein
MGLLQNILGSATGKLIGTVAKSVDDLTLSKEEKEQFNLEMQRLVQDQMAMVEASVQARFEAVKGIIVAEMESGDNYTKRARPTVVYGGLVLFALQVLAQMFVGIPPIVIPTEFVVAWASVVGVWSIGRSFEKTRGQTTVSKAVTGTPTTNPSILDVEL